jgi:catechol 2,3-dioxygenase-like lactoylglutathione lyase family enzyme
MKLFGSSFPWLTSIGPPRTTRRYSIARDGGSPPAGTISINQEHLYFAVDDLEAVHRRARRLAAGPVDETIVTRPWGERSFYLRDPFGNPLCMVHRPTAFSGNWPD